MKERSETIDITKGLLVLGMVLAHAIQFLGDGRSQVLNAASLGANLGSFSGFMFCFGFASWVAYLQKATLPWSGIVRTTTKCYAAFVVSGVAYRVLVDSAPLNAALIARVALIRDIPGYSEFLLSFAVITILAALFRDAIRVSTERLPHLALSIAACLTLTLLPSEARYDPIVGQLIGGQGFAFFPTVQYLPLFLMGVFVARQAEGVSVPASIAAACSVIGFWSLTALEIPIDRFPPSAVWIICSAGLAYLYYGFAHVVQLHGGRAIKSYLNAVGRHVLRYLLLSNLVFFGCVALGLRASLGTLEVGAFFAGLVVLILLTHARPNPSKRSRQSLDQAA